MGNQLFHRQLTIEYQTCRLFLQLYRCTIAPEKGAFTYTDVGA